jgi:predicted TPR repeat methyltransferase
VHLPPQIEEHFDQDEVFFYLSNDDDRLKVRFHDYRAIYQHQGLYEQLFYDRLKCQSPKKIAAIVNQVVSRDNGHMSKLRVLDLGAGNGMAGEELADVGVSRIVGVDIIDEARAAAFRDRPGIYDHYYVTDLCKLSDNLRAELRTWSFNCLVSVAALGFGDIPPKAIATAFDIIEHDGWIAFNIKDTFLDSNDTSGFSLFVRELIRSRYLDLHHMERYQHRLSINGQPLNYYAIAGRKRGETLPASVLALVSAGASA